MLFDSFSKTGVTASSDSQNGLIGNVASQGYDGNAQVVKLRVENDGIYWNLLHLRKEFL